jgi:hypothetical protein
MAGDDRVRFCARCARRVFNVAAMSRTEAERVLAENEPAPCMRIHRRADGTVLTADCPVGARRRHGRRLVMAAAATGLVAAASATGPSRVGADAQRAARLAHWAEVAADPIAAAVGPYGAAVMGRVRPK